jgi:hypothetical protein
VIGSRARCLLVAGGFAVSLLVGCGSDEPNAASTGAPAQATAPAAGTTSDGETARAALVRLDDLPAGWTSTPQNGQARATCAAIQHLRARPRAVSPGFVQGDGGVVHTVTIFPTAADADRIFTEVVGRANRRCIARSITEGGRMLVPADVKVGDAVASHLHVETPARRIEAIRYTLPLRRGAARARFFEDYVTARVGRGISILWLRSRFVRPDDSLRARLTTRTVARLRATLSQ